MTDECLCRCQFYPAYRDGSCSAPGPIKTGHRLWSLGCNRQVHRKALKRDARPHHHRRDSSFSTTIPIDIKVELDRRFIKLGDVLELLDGGVVALTKPAGEPLDIFIGGVIAFGTGEVIVLNEELPRPDHGLRCGGQAVASALPFAVDSSPDYMPLPSEDSGTLGLLLDQMVCVGVVVGRAEVTAGKSS